MAKKIALAVFCALMVFPACRTGAGTTYTVKCYSGGVLIYETDRAIRVHFGAYSERLRWFEKNVEHESSADCITYERR